MLGFILIMIACSTIKHVGYKKTTAQTNYFSNWHKTFSCSEILYGSEMKIYPIGDLHIRTDPAISLSEPVLTDLFRPKHVSLNSTAANRKISIFKNPNFLLSEKRSSLIFIHPVHRIFCERIIPLYSIQLHMNIIVPIQ